MPKRSAPPAGRGDFYDRSLKVTQGEGIREGGARGEGPTAEQLRAAYEAELKRLRVEDILLEQVASLVNLGMRRTGLAPGSEDERDLAQVRVAIEAVRALMPLVEQVAGAHAPAIRDALSQLQLAFVRLGGAAGAATQPTSQRQTGAAGQGTGATGQGGGAQGAPAPGAGGAQPAGERIRPGEPGPAERSGRLWVPGR